MINEAWPLRPLGELFEIGAGKTMSAAARDGAEKTPFLRTSNVLWDEIDLTKVDEMAIPPRELSGKLLRPGDLLVCEGGEIGRAATEKRFRAVVARPSISPAHAPPRPHHGARGAQGGRSGA